MVNRIVALCLVSVILSGYAQASTTIKLRLIPENVSNTNKMRRIGVGTFYVKLYVFVDKKIFKSNIECFPGADIGSVLERAYPVRRGQVCADPIGIQCINNVCQDLDKHKYWEIRLNGNVQNTSSHSRLTEGDVLELIYVQDEAYRPTHVDLETWLSSYKGK